jgi:hypothetical protein
VQQRASSLVEFGVRQQQWQRRVPDASADAQRA